MAAALLLAVVLSFGVNQSVQATTQKVVIIHVDDQEITVSTDLETVGEVLDKAGVNIGKNDAVEPATDTKILENVINVNIYRARPVTVFDQGHTYIVNTPYESPRLIAKSVGVKVYPEDHYRLEQINDEILQTEAVGQRLIIERATPVIINLYGNIIKHRTHATTVKELLEEKDIDLKPKDQLKPSLSAPVHEDMVVSIARSGTKIVTKREVIPAPVKTITDTNLPLGEQVVRDPGQPGERIVTYEVKLLNGVPAGRRAIQTVIVTEPQQRIVVVGAHFGGDVWAKLRACESGGDYSRNSGNGFYGAYQFLPSTFSAVAPPDYRNVRPDLAPPSIQDIAAQNLQRGSGWDQWPACAAKLGLL